MRRTCDFSVGEIIESCGNIGILNKFPGIDNLNLGLLLS